MKGTEVSEKIITGLERSRTGWENLEKDLVIEMRENMTALLF
jgi:hypothetical protein